MIYFLVNNDYQLLDANFHALALRDQGMELTLIPIPHALRCAPPPGLYQATIQFESPITGRRRWPAAWLRYFTAAKQVATLCPAKDDVLVLYTEYELLNHFIMNRFRAAGARVVLIEDGGVGTYLPFSDVPSQALSLRERLAAWSVRRLPGLADTRFKKVNGVIFPWRPDEQIDLLCVYRHFNPARRIPTMTIQGALAVCAASPVAGRVVFLNECIYDHYQDDASYLRGLDQILAALTAGYREVLFKFHPREQQGWRDRIREEVLKQYPGVQVIHENLPFELLLEKYAPEALASYFSTPLMNLSGTSIEPLFLYHLLDDLRDQPIFALLTRLLHGWQYRFVANWSEVQNGYKSQMNFQAEHGAVQQLSGALRTLRPATP